MLAYYCPIGSHISGYELAEPILDYARRRRYQHRSGMATTVDFVCQAVTQRLREPNASVDVINASGIVGHHLKAETIWPLLAEIKRVLKPGGVAMLDVGPTLRGRVLRRIMAAAGFAFLGHYRCWFGDLTGEMVFRRRSLDAES